MRIKIMIILGFVILVLLNYSIYEKEQIKNYGQTLMLELAPVDPRSLMQGDYMLLRYAIESGIPSEKMIAAKKRGYMVILPDENNVAKFVRFYDDTEKLNTGEMLLRFHKRYNNIEIEPRSFLFQEGHAKYYEGARYGIFKFDDSGSHLLVGLADDSGQPIVVPDSELYRIWQ